MNKIMDVRPKEALYLALIATMCAGWPAKLFFSHTQPPNPLAAGHQCQLINSEFVQVFKASGFGLLFVLLVVCTRCNLCAPPVGMHII